jgi:uncharacterized membrane protein
MELGPTSVLAIQFDGVNFKGEILNALAELVRAGTVRVVDAVVVRKDAEGKIDAQEVNQLGIADLRIFDPLQAEVTGLLSNQDIEDIGALLANSTASGILVLEHIWATKLVHAIQSAGGTVVLNRLLMPEVVAENLALIENIN